MQNWFKLVDSICQQYLPVNLQSHNPPVPATNLIELGAGEPSKWLQEKIKQCPGTTTRAASEDSHSKENTQKDSVEKPSGDEGKDKKAEKQNNPGKGKGDGGGKKKDEGKFVELPGAEMGKVVVRFPPEASG